MGISIHVIVDPSCISQRAWQRVHDETVRILRGWPDPPVRPRYHEVAGIEVVAYARDVVGTEGWHICGDATSRRMGESIELPLELGVDDPRPPSRDLVLRIVDEDHPPHDDPGLCWLLDGNTLGRPFHTLVLAVAMLIEHRLPHAAFVGGDFMREQAEEAQARLESILDEEIPLPLCTEPERLRERLRPLVPSDALDDAVRRAAHGVWGCRGMLAGLAQGIVGGTLGSRPHAEIEAAVSCTDASALDEDTRAGFGFLVAQSKALFGRPLGEGTRAAFPVEHEGLDRTQLLQVIARGTSRTFLRLTEMAWHEIQRASVDELRLLAMLATRSTSGLIAHQLRLAVFESPAIRRLCLERWETTPPVMPSAVPWQARLFEESRGLPPAPQAGAAAP